MKEHTSESRLTTDLTFRRLEIHWCNYPSFLGSLIKMKKKNLTSADTASNWSKHRSLFINKGLKFLHFTNL